MTDIVASWFFFSIQRCRKPGELLVKTTLKKNTRKSVFSEDVYNSNVYYFVFNPSKKSFSLTLKFKRKQQKDDKEK